MLPENVMSMMQFYSYGIVAQPKNRKDMVVYVTPIEQTSYMDGELQAKKTQTSAKGVDASGSPYVAKADTSAAIQATWLPLGGSNRITAPDVQRGEEVVLVTLANSSEKYWVTTTLWQKLRRLETVIWAFSGSSAHDLVPSSDNSYYVEVSTHDNHIVLSTSDRHGEKCRYFIEIDPGNGEFRIFDNVGNSILLNSLQPRIRFENRSGTIMDMMQTNVTWTVPGTYAVKCTSYQINADAGADISCGSFNMSASDDSNISAGGSMTVSGDSEATVSGGSTLVLTSDATFVVNEV
jgi:hypothetical protein